MSDLQRCIFPLCHTSYPDATINCPTCGFSRKSWQRARKLRVAIGFGLVLLGSVLFFFMIRSLDSEIESASKNKTDSTKHITIVTIVQTGQEGLAAIAGLGAAGCGVLFGLALVLHNGTRLLMGPRGAPATPIKALRQFYQNAINQDTQLGKDAESARLEAFACLTPAARREIQGLHGFKEHWNQARAAIFAAAHEAPSEHKFSELVNACATQGGGPTIGKVTADMDNVQIEPLTEATASYQATLWCSVVFMLQGQRIETGKHMYQIAGSLCCIEGRWCLAAGHWNFGKNSTALPQK